MKPTVGVVAKLVDVETVETWGEAGQVALNNDWAVSLAANNLELGKARTARTE